MECTEKPFLGKTIALMFCTICYKISCIAFPARCALLIKHVLKRRLGCVEAKSVSQQHMVAKTVDIISGSMLVLATPATARWQHDTVISLVCRRTNRCTLREMCVHCLEGYYCEQSRSLIEIAINHLLIVSKQVCWTV